MGNFAPSLSEIQSYRGDANIAGGTAGVGSDVPAPDPVNYEQGLQFLNQASMARAEYNKYLNQQYAVNLNNSLNNLRSIDLSKTLSSDLPALRQKYADLAKGVSDNFDAIRNPASNPEAAAQLAQQEAELRGQIAQSEAHNAILTHNKNFIAANPTFNTAQNQALVSNFENTPMDQRKDFLLQTPNNFDVNSLAKAAGQYATQAVSKESLSKDGKWINSTEGTQFAQDQYHKATLALLHNTIQDGQPLYDKYMADYNLLPPDLKKSTSPDDYILGVVDALAPQTALKTSFKANPYGTLNQEEAFSASQSDKARAFEAGQNALNRALQVKMLKKGELDPTEAAEGKLRTIAGAYTTGNLEPQLAQTIYGDNSKITKNVKVIGVGDDGKTPTIENNKIQVPLTQVSGTSLDDQGNLHIHRIDNSTGKALPDLVRSYNEAYSDYDKLYGDNYAPQMSGATAKYSQQQFKKVTPTLEDLQSHFSIPKVVTNKYDPNDPANLPFQAVPTGLQGNAPILKDIAPSTDGGLSTDAYNNFLRKNGLLK